MKFFEMIHEAIHLLRDGGRVSRRGLQRHFEIDDYVLNDLVCELVEVRKIARIDYDETLVWVGERGAGRYARTSSGVVEAEHRQLTVMFCDIVESTALVERVDSETWRDILQDYRRTVADVMLRFEGEIAQYLGDGVMAYFGYPHAHEDDAERAIHAALEVCLALAERNTRAKHAVEVRIAVHTGRVLVDLGSEEQQFPSALGEVPHVASRLLLFTAPGTVVISGATLRLVRGLFRSQSLGAKRIKGITRTIEIHEVLGIGEARTRFEAETREGVSTLVGRAQELGELRHRWMRAAAGSGQVVVLSGEAGIGKSRLILALKNEVLAGSSRCIEFRCSSYHCSTALYPFVEHLERQLNFLRADNARLRLERLRCWLDGYTFPREDTIALFSHLLSLPAGHGVPALRLDPERLQQRLADTLLEWLLEESAHDPVCCVFEDVHWMDPSTRQLLARLADEVPRRAMLLVQTCRPEFELPWQTGDAGAHIELSRLRRSEVEALMTEIAAGRELPHEVVEQIASKTDGVPLFVEELTKTVLESGLLRLQGARYELDGPLPPLAIPSTLQDSLMARLDRLGSARELAQVGAVIGREFSSELIAAVLGQDPAILQVGLQRLIGAELVYPSGRPRQATYVFKHALVQDTAYQSLLTATRQHLHLRVARKLEQRFPAVAAREPELLAIHYSRAGLAHDAIRHWLRAAEQAMARSATTEAIEHLGEGLDHLTEIADAEVRTRHELALRALLGTAFIAARGYGASDTARCFDRAYVLLPAAGNSAERFPVLYGCWVYNLTWANFAKARAMAEEFLERATAEGDSGAILTGHRILGFTQAIRGELTLAKDNLSRVIELYEPEQHATLAYRYGQDPRAAATAMLGFTEWQLGFPERAVRLCAEAERQAQRLQHANTRGYVQTFGAARVAVLRRDECAVRRHLDSLRALCEEHNLVFWSGFIATFEGWLLNEAGTYDAAEAAVQDGLRRAQASRTGMFRPHALAILAAAELGADRCGEALRTVDSALATAQRTAEHWSTPELMRLKGEVLLRQADGTGHQEDAEACFHAAIAEARRRDARAWQLRSATSLARLYVAHGKTGAARDALARVLETFDEGFNTPDLRDAQAQLAVLH